MAVRRDAAQMRFAVRTSTKSALARIGIDVRHIRSSSQTRPVGDMKAFLEDLAGRRLRVSDALDVGANRGEWATLATAVFPGCRVSMIEPQVEMTPYLDAFCREHPGSAWTCAGAGSQESTMTLTLWEDLAGSSFLPAEGDSSGKRQRQVPVVTIDSLLSAGSIRLPQIAKLDVQGFELEVLKGSRSLFGHTEVFIVETSLVSPLGQPLVDEVITFMRSHGYRFYDLAGFLRRPSDGALGQVDICFARADGPLCASETW